MVSLGTNHATTLFGASVCSVSIMRLMALQAINVLPPAVGTFKVTRGTPFTVFTYGCR